MSKGSQIEIYPSFDGSTQIEVQLEQETVWPTQAQIVPIFDSSKANSSEHIKNICSTGELNEQPTVRKFRTVQHIWINKTK